uniref:Uncharacterized protein n=1 Tax=Oryza glumipatula TaxID=40148 RepID=A0A0D9ZJ62_9ORYZ
MEERRRPTEERQLARVLAADAEAGASVLRWPTEDAEAGPGGGGQCTRGEVARQRGGGGGGDGVDWPGRGGSRRQPPNPATAVAAAVVEAGTSDVAFSGVVVKWPHTMAYCGGGGRRDAWRAAGWRKARWRPAAFAAGEQKVSAVLVAQRVAGREVASWRGARCNVRSPAWSYARCTVTKADGALPGVGTGHGRSSVRTSSEGSWLLRA